MYLHSQSYIELVIESTYEFEFPTLFQAMCNNNTITCDRQATNDKMKARINSKLQNHLGSLKCLVYI